MDDSQPCDEAGSDCEIRQSAAERQRKPGLSSGAADGDEIIDAIRDASNDHLTAPAARTYYTGVCVLSPAGTALDNHIAITAKKRLNVVQRHSSVPGFPLCEKYNVIVPRAGVRRITPYGQSA